MAIQLGKYEEIFSPIIDLVFKRIFTGEGKESNETLKDFLASIIGKGVDDVVINQNELSVTGIGEKQSTMDINCKFNDGEQANVEIQLKDENDMQIRAEYNLCKLHSGQSIKGKEYTDLKNTYQITITNYTLFKGDDEAIDEFCFRSKAGRILEMGKTKIYFIELSKLQKLLKIPVESLTKAQMWAIYLKYVNDTSKRNIINKIIEKEEGLAMASELLQKIAKDDEMRIALYAREKAETDRLASEARMKRLAREEGELLGKQEEKVLIAKKLLLMKLDIDEISKITELTQSEIEKLK